jgi:hypothetical protein
MQYVAYLNCGVSHPPVCVDIPEYIVEYGRANLLKVLGDEPSPWCQNEPPISYTYIQVPYQTFRH